MMKNRNGHCRVFRPGIKLLCYVLLIMLVFQSAIPASVAFAADDGITTLSAVCRDADGKNYRITAKYDETAEIPEDAVLSASAIGEDDTDFEEYAAQAVEALGADERAESSVRLFDISIVSGNNSEVTYQPAEGSAVTMKIRLAEEIETENELCVVHLGEEAEVLESDLEGRSVTFEATGFSVYAFVDIGAVDYVVTDETAFDELPVYLSATTLSGNTYYMCGDIVSSGQGNVISRTAQNETAGAVLYYFEKLDGTTNHYYIYKLDGETKKYIKFNSSGVASFVTSGATEFTVSACRSEYPKQFQISCVQGDTTYYLNLRKDENGKGFNGSTYSSNDPNHQFTVGSNITAHYVLEEGDDLGLDGKTYGIAVPMDKNMAGVLTAEALTETKLQPQFLPVRANPLVEGNEMVINVNGDITLYTFHSITKDTYYLTTVVGGTTKYLRLQGGGATLTDTPDNYCVLTVKTGTGPNSDKVRIYSHVGNANQFLSLYTSNSSNQYFYAKTASGATSYFKLCEPSFLGNDDFVPYTAIKVSVSDRSKVHNGSKVVVYTRVWNDTAKQYEFYAINHDGSLVRCYDEGDTIRWAGTQVNTMLWNFTEYYYWPYFLQIPNYYYELQNTYSGKYIAPQYHTGQILSDRTIGINLNGRRFGDYYSTILAWDDARYDYAGVKTSADNSAITAVPMSNAQDFYFAIMDDPQHAYFPSVPTVDNYEHGITMKMVDFNGQKYDSGNRDRIQTDVMGEGSDQYTGGTIPMLDLVTTDLDENGYPVAVRTDKSLEELFGSAEDVNHLFLQSIYDESGYFEYNCTQTFATLLESGNFRVYNQIGTVELNAASQGHGWFMPYNDIDPSIVSSYTNITDVQNNALPSNDPRLGETLYGIPKEEADYHFGMEMEASFIQSKNGLDAWGHDIIFEFTGDDDMWLYVDGELVLDLGGVHSALKGTINFRTGEVSIPDAEGHQYTTSLYNIFKSNYEARNPEATQAAVQEHLDRIFTEGETPGTHVFKDYTSHTMKMFYMERGAQASNLHMRFNLTTAVEGQLLLTKAVSGTDKQDYASARFPYQIWYYDTDCAEWRTVSRTETTDEGITVYEYAGARYVNYEATRVPVEYAPTYTVDELITYNDVFFLKPGETAEIQFPSDETEYYIKECGVNTNIYDAVTANDVPLTGVPTLEITRSDFSTEPEVIGQRKLVTFDNHVSPNALRTLTITKKLFDVNYQPLAYPADTTGFRFRVYIGEGNDKTVDGVDYGYYRMDSYYVKDNQGYYCWYNYETQQFESLGKNDFSQLTEEDLDICTFTTSPSGAVDKIPADHSVEIRNLLVDTNFYIEERESDIPKGYDLIGYDRAEASYISGSPYNCGTIRDNADPHLIVNNHRGWGLTVQKVWTDANFMLSHDNIYFAVYCKDHLVTDPDVHAVRRMKTQVDLNDQADEAESSLYFYFKALETGAEFSDYSVKEVALTDPVVDENGYVTSYSSMTILGDAVQLVNGGIPQQTNTHATFYYDVTYETGTPGGPAENIRTDTVTNSRPGVKLVKTDAVGNPLPGAVFTLQTSDGSNVVQSSYTSNAQGLITFAYPEQNVTYTLTEIQTPSGYSALINSVQFTLNGAELTVTNTDSPAVTVSEPDADGMITVSLKNYLTTIRAIKEDSVSNQPLKLAHFALYRQVIGKNGPIRDYYPMTGYTDLITDGAGVIPQIDGTLPVGTYYLHETTAPYGYYLLDHDIIFTVTDKGAITLSSEETAATLTNELNAQNEQIYTLHVPNRSTIKSVKLTPQTLVADFGLDIEYDVTLNNHLARNAVYTYIGITDEENYDAFGSLEMPELLCGTNASCKGLFGTLTLTEEGIASYQIDTMQFSGEDTFYLVASVSEIDGEEVESLYCYETITYIPATTVYYEDDFRGVDIYQNGEEPAGFKTGFGIWSVPGEGDRQTNQAADLAAAADANIFGYDPAYTEFGTFSNNYAHKVTVSTINNPRKGGAWPYMEFDFAGTGFDLISVTGCDTGVFAVTVYPYETNDNGEPVLGEAVRNSAVDTYYGYEYGRLFLAADGSATLEDTGTPLYKATEELISAASPQNLLKASGKFFTTETIYYDTVGDLTETPYYYDDKGAVTATPYYVNVNDAEDVRAEVPKDAQNLYTPNYAYALAEGWILNKNATDSIYQIPVLKIRDLKYGSYRAHVEPRFASFYGHYNSIDYNNTRVDYFDLYVDAIRVYDPAGVSSNGTLTSQVIQEAYLYSNEAYEKFTTLKSVIVGSDSLSLDASTPGMVVVDSNVPLTTDRITDYAQFGPNCELYLSKGMSVAFQICATEIPADLQIMMKKISSADPTMQVTYIDKNATLHTQSLDICSTTDLSYSIMNLIGRDNITWQKLKSKDAFYASGMFILTNVSPHDSVISVTNLKWTFKNVGGSYMIPDGNYWVSVTPKNVSSVRSVMSFMAKNLALPEEKEASAVYEDGTVTLTVTTGDAVDTLVIKDSDGNLIDESLLDIAFEDIDGSLRQWTVTLEDVNDDLYTFLVYAQNDGITDGDPIRVTVHDARTEPEPPTDPAQNEDPTEPTGPAGEDPGTNSGNGSGGNSSGSFLQKLRELWLRFIDLLKKLLKLFNISF